MARETIVIIRENPGTVGESVMRIARPMKHSLQHAIGRRITDPDMPGVPGGARPVIEPKTIFIHGMNA